LLSLASLFLAVAAHTVPGLRPSETVPRLTSANSFEEESDDYEPPIPRNCAVPRPRRYERIVLLGFGHGSAVLTYSIAGADAETTSGEIRIGPGPSGIFLVLTSYYPILYRITGHVDRLSRVVLLAQGDAGITGVDGRNVTFGLGNNCFIGLDGPSTAKHFKSLFGRKPNAFASEDEIHLWKLGAHGAGHAVEAPHHDYVSGSTDVEQDMDAQFPGGIVAIRPKELVSSRTAVPYELLPSIVGLLQLQRAGAIVPATKGEISQWRGKAGARYGAQIAQYLTDESVYRVTRHINLPAHLCRPVTFLVPARHYVSDASCHANIIGTDGRIYHWAGHHDPEELTDRR
jgi:hypothetical protein